MEYSLIAILLLAAGSQAQMITRSAYLEKVTEVKDLVFPPGGRPFDVTVDIFIRNIPRFDDLKQEFDIDMSFRQTWVDKRLAFESTYVDYINLPQSYYDKIWRPDTFICNVVAEKIKADERSSLIRIYRNGTVFASRRQMLTIYCRMNFERLPFDKHTCQVNVSSWAQTTQDIVYHWKQNVSEPSDIDKDLFVFEIKDITFEDTVQHTPSGDYSRLIMNIVFDREFSFYFHHIFTPFVVLVNISWFTFFIHPSKVAARIIFEILLLTAATILSAIVNSKLPATTYGKAIDTWISSCIIFIFLAIIETVVAVHFHHAKKMQDEEEAKKSDEEQLIPGKGKVGSRWKESEEKKGCAWKCSNWFTQRADKIDPMGKHIILGLFHVFIFYFVIRWTFF